MLQLVKLRKLKKKIYKLKIFKKSTLLKFCENFKLTLTRIRVKFNTFLGIVGYLSKYLTKLTQKTKIMRIIFKICHQNPPAHQKKILRWKYKMQLTRGSNFTQNANIKPFTKGLRYKRITPANLVNSSSETNRNLIING